MLNQPISQVRLTNVALIKYKLHNRKYLLYILRILIFLKIWNSLLQKQSYKLEKWNVLMILLFETILNYISVFYREKDLDEVLQSNNIFTNASQGQLAGKDELKKYFPGLDRKEILKIVIIINFKKNINLFNRSSIMVNCKSATRKGTVTLQTSSMMSPT